MIIRELEAKLYGEVAVEGSGTQESAGWLRIIFTKKPRGKIEKCEELHVEERLQKWRETMPAWWPRIFEDH